MQRIHGLVVASSDQLPGIAAARDGEPDVAITFVEALRAPAESARIIYLSSDEDSFDDPALEIARDDECTTYRYSDGTELDLYLDADPVRIDAVIAPGQTLEDFAAYLYGPVLGLVLRTRGCLALHASCIDTDEGAVLFAADSGAGKSTTAAAFSALGHPVLSDDLTALTVTSAGYVAHAAFDHIRLWSNAEMLLFGREKVLDRITPTWDKLRFALHGERFSSEPRPVRAIYLLDDGARPAEAAGVHEIGPAEALLRLTTATYVNYLLDAAMRATELAQLGALLRAVPVRRLVNRGTTLPELCELVYRDLDSLCAPFAS
jgi:hypothetical protein